MKSTRQRLLAMMALAVSAQAQWSMADPGSTNDCYWQSAPGLMTFRVNVGDVYVPRDAKVGSVIGTFEKPFFTGNGAGLEMYCSNDGSVRLNFQAIATAPIFSGSLPPVGGEDFTGKVFETGVNNGVGARIKLGLPFDGSADNAFIPTGPPVVPFDAFANHRMNSVMPFSRLFNSATLVKTGPIPTGPHSFSRKLFIGNFTTLNTVFEYELTGRVIQSQCSVLTNPVSADPVQLGEWQTSDFTHEGFTTAPIPFHITLSNCLSDPSGGNQATAHIRLDGANGSLPVGDGSSGVFSLSTDSTATGMGIQILLADGNTPVRLGTEVPLTVINHSGSDTVLPFTARFYQTADSADIQAGTAKGSLGFTMTYQ